MIDLIKRALFRIKLAYWRRYRPSKYCAYIAQRAAQGFAEGVKKASDAFKSVEIACKAASAKSVEQCGAHIEYAMCDEIDASKHENI